MDPSAEVFAGVDDMLRVGIGIFGEGEDLRGKKSVTMGEETIPVERRGMKKDDDLARSENAMHEQLCLFYFSMHSISGMCN